MKCMYDTRFCLRCINFCIIVLDNDNFITSFKDFHLVTRINKSSKCNHETVNNEKKKIHVFVPMIKGQRLYSLLLLIRKG